MEGRGRTSGGTVTPALRMRRAVPPPQASPAGMAPVNRACTIRFAPTFFTCGSAPPGRVSRRVIGAGALTIPALLTPVQIFVGDVAARGVADHQPAKFAGMECIYETGPDQTEWLGGICTDDEVKWGIGIPGLDGYEVARRLRARFGGDVMLVALTGYGAAESREAAHDAGFDQHVVKPIDPSRLEQLLAGAGQRRAVN